VGNGHNGARTNSYEEKTTMIGYVTLGTNNLERAGKFYDALLGELGGKRYMENDRLIAWSAGQNVPGIGVCKPYDGKSACVGNGSMVALNVDSPEKVKKLYDLALKMGGKDEGAPGLRFGNFYAAYFRDPDGNKLNAFCMTA
jgi:catechol 2,3-dioxygenase-like lactoylglutathione lyase family enzyme